jgi:hypothetical protein
MKPVDRSELLGLGAYEQIREPFRTRIIQEKKLRRVALGTQMTAVFENHDTVLMQVQEMLRTERITREDAIAHELATYNELVPRERELSVTFMVEIDDKPTREAFLVAAKGLEATLRLHVGAHTVPATWDPARAGEERLSAVLYTKFQLSEAAYAAALSGTGFTLEVDHAAYKARAELPATTAKALVEDLSA